MTLILETERLILRPFKSTDVPAFYEYRNDPEVARYQGWETPYSLEAAQEYVQFIQGASPAKPGEWVRFAVELRSSGQMIGDCNYYTLAGDPRQAEIGFTLARPFQRQGYMTEAVLRLLDYLFFELGLHRVRANCDVENLPSAHLLERIGMRREAHHIESLWFKGRWSSEYWYAVLSREWAARRPGEAGGRPE